MLKRFTCLSLVLALLLGNLSVKAAGKSLNVEARCAIAIDANSSAVLYEKNSHELVPMASTTKIMSSLVAIKYGNLDKKVEISQKAASIGGSTVGYKKGEMITIKELITGLMLRSGNDAAVALSEGVAGSVEEFVILMNEYGSDIGLIDTHFESPHGLDSIQHYTTVYDLALLTAKAKENQLFNQIVSSKIVDGQSEGFTRSYQNINKILWLIPEADGVKTGYTGNAGKCLVTSVNKEGSNVVIVLLNCTKRWGETKKISDYISENYTYKKMFSKGDTAGEIQNKKGNLKMIYPCDIIIPMLKNKEYYVKIIKPEYAEGIKAGDTMGRICIYAEDKLVYSHTLTASN